MYGNGPGYAREKACGIGIGGMDHFFGQSIKGPDKYDLFF
jgi:hypothetical protein